MSSPLQGSELPLRFGRFELRPREYRLLADGQPVALGGRAMDLLLALAARAGQLLTRNELIEHVWPGRVVEDNNLSVQIKALRKALGDEWLVTVPGRGYRLDLPRPAAGRAPPAAASHLPRPPAPPLPLIGRRADLESLHALVEQHRLVTVLGAGGIGKTRLAQTLLHARGGLHADGVAWVELGPLGTAEALPAAVAAALGMQPTPADPLSQLARTLEGLQLLLVLDNAEHLLEAVATLAHTLLGACSGLRLVVTSQAPLKLAAEHVLRLGPLDLPQTAQPSLSAAEAQAFGAVALFCDRAAAADHRFVLQDADVAAVVGLCQGLDGLPLAIELAASRAAALGIETLRAALGSQLQLLAGNRDRLAPPRQRSLRAALEWSVGLLPPAASELFRCLGVVAGSASLALVQQLGADEPCPWEVVDALDELVQRSLVDLVHESADASPRYRLLELPRTLALEMLAACGQEDQVRQRHAQAVLADFEAGRQALVAGRLGLRAVDRLNELNMANAREALAYARRHENRTLELALASASMPAASSAERLALADRCTALMAMADAQTPLDPQLELRVQRAISVALANLWPVRSKSAARRAVELARQFTGQPLDRFELYAALCGLAQKLTGEGGNEQSELLLREALTLEDPDWPPVLRWVGLRTRGLLAMARGEAHLAVPIYRHLLDSALAAHEPGHMQLLQLANAELAAGDARAAVADGERLLAQLAGSRNENVLAHASVNLLLAYLALGDVAPARAMATQLFGGAQPLRLHAWFIDALALLAAVEQRHEAAARLAQAADARYVSAAGLRQINEQRAHDRTLALLAEAGCPPPANPEVSLADAELIALALARP